MHLNLEEQRKVKYACSKCDATFINKDNLETHFKVKHDRESLQIHICPHCAKPFDLVASLNKHIQSIHDKVEYVCHVCNAIFYLKSNLKRHIERHKNVEERKFQCPMCPKLVVKLKKHIRLVHEKSRPYVCSICNFAFGQRVNLKVHISGFHKGGKS